MQNEKKKIVVGSALRKKWKEKILTSRDPYLPSLKVVGEGRTMLRFERNATPVDLQGEKNYRSGSGLGPIRDQDEHEICHIFACTDTLSWFLRELGETDGFKVLSARSIAADIDRSRRKAIRATLRAQRKAVLHLCFGGLPETCFKYMRDADGVTCLDRDADGVTCLDGEGIRFEDVSEITEEFSCVIEALFDFDLKIYPSLSTMRVLVIPEPSTNQIIDSLQNGPLVACVRCFDDDYDELGPEDIYYGPKLDMSVFADLHSVVVAQVKFIGGVHVAVCKSSHGIDTHDEGYISVSLDTFFVAMDANEPKILGLIARITVITF